MSQAPRQPHPLDYARHLPAQPVRHGMWDAAVVLLVMTGTMLVNAALLVWLGVDLKVRMEASAASGLTAILIGMELVASICWSLVLAVAARRFLRQPEGGGPAVVLYGRGKTLLAIVAFGLNASVSIFDLAGDKTLSMLTWIIALAGLLLTGILSMGYRK